MHASKGTICEVAMSCREHARGKAEHDPGGNTRLTEVRGFSDFFSEFFTALRKTQFPPNMRMVVLCNRPNYELRAFQVSLRAAAYHMTSFRKPAGMHSRRL